MVQLGMPALTRDQKILRATNTLASHVHAWGYLPQIEYRLDCAMISVNGGQALRIGHGPVDLDPGQISSANLKILEAALRTAAATMGIPCGQIRYRTPKASPANLEYDFEDIIFRAKSFALAPNPTAATFKKWHPILKQQTNSVYFKSKRILNAFGYEYEDLYNIAQVHLCTALHRFVLGEEKEDNKIVGQYVKQRLIEVTTKIKRKSERCVSLPDQRDLASISVH